MLRTPTLKEVPALLAALGESTSSDRCGKGPSGLVLCPPTPVTSAHLTSIPESRDVGTPKEGQVLSPAMGQTQGGASSRSPWTIIPKAGAGGRLSELVRPAALGGAHRGGRALISPASGQNPPQSASSASSPAGCAGKPRTPQWGHTPRGSSQ